MAGKGFAPRTAGNMRVLISVPAKQPPLPRWRTWHRQTRAWWKMWAVSPLSEEFTDTDWAFLLDTAILQDAFYAGELKQAAEIRLRVAKFGQTVEDRARLRITFASADTADEKADAKRESAADRRKQRLRVVGE